MHWNRIQIVLILAIPAIILTGCPQEVSRVTDLEYTEFQEQETPPGLMPVEGGTFVMGRTKEDVMGDWNNIPRRVTVRTFYMGETEVSNFEYLEYLHWTKRFFGETNPEIYRNALPDTLVWRDPLAYNEPYVENYLRHPAYHDYPVVGVSWAQATEYAKWLTDRENERILVEEEILEWNVDGQEDGMHFTTQAYLHGELDLDNLRDLNPVGDVERRVRWEDGILLPQYRLPTEAEWEYAALGLIGSTYDEKIADRRQYPWEGHHVRSADRRTRGDFKANFQRGPGDFTGVAGYHNPGGDPTMPVKSFEPNDFGLYNMAGNVNEWVQDVYRPLSHETVAEFRPFRGNVFQRKQLDEEGNVMFDERGEILYEEIEPEDNQTPRDYREANYSDYRDGDESTAISEDHDVYPEGSTLITNSVRVFKGGSWKDRIYWLSPGNRRFLDQNEATNDIGFRVAMEKMGPSSD